MSERNSTIDDKNLIVSLQNFSVSFPDANEDDRLIKFTNVSLIPSNRVARRTWNFILSAEVVVNPSHQNVCRILFDFSQVETELSASFSFPMEGTITERKTFFDPIFV